MPRPHRTDQPPRRPAQGHTVPAARRTAAAAHQNKMQCAARPCRPCSPHALHCRWSLSGHPPPPRQAPGGGKANTIATTELGNTDATAKIKSNTICYTAEKDKPISVNIAKHPQFISNEYIDGQGIFTFKNKITSIPEKAFFDCSKLDSIIIPESVTEIGNSVFTRCHYLKMVYCQSTTPPTLGENAFSNISREAKICVPKNSVALYKSANGWKDYASKIVGCDFK